MSLDAFNPAFAFVLHWEGGLTDDPDDPGGRTNKGITQTEYDAWRLNLGMEIRDVADITDTEIQKIYWTDYWLKASCAPLIQKLDLLQFDTAVNIGKVRAIRFLQSSAGCVVDGIFGANTATAVSRREYIPLVTTYCNARANYYDAIVQKKPKLVSF